MGTYLKYQKPVCSGFFYGFIIYLGITLGYSCKQSGSKNISPDYHSIRGETMGTTYHINLETSDPDKIKKDIDDILIEINKSVSTYDQNSLISLINKSENLNLKFPSDRHFETNYFNARNIYIATDGLFDPTVMPLVNYWGFGYQKRNAPDYIDSLKIDSIHSLVGLSKWNYHEEEDSFTITKPLHAELDFSAIAKGYAVDCLAQYIESLGAENYMVEIGGEVYAKGINRSKKHWSIGLNTPREDAQITDFEKIVSVDGKGLASSGNYRNFRMIDGVKYGHEINPHNGYSINTEILGVSVISDKCMIADAYATAFMIMNKSRVLEICNKTPDLEAIVFFGKCGWRNLLSLF